MEIVEDKPERIVLRMPANETLANAIRRSVSEVKTLAIEEVEFYKNDSALYDEMIALRLGLVPLKTEKKMGDKTEVQFKLAKKGPCTVYSGDLEGNAKVVYEKIPITILEDGHSLELVATARLGNGNEHAKHLPGLCYYRHLKKVQSTPEADKIVQESAMLVKPEKKGAYWICDPTDAAVKELEEELKVEVSDADELVFVIESFGMMPAKEILKTAIEVLEANLDEVESAVGK
ncbi:DNA-directed RNA polymerase subunit D [Candidatus Pacearchaeota archaeon]|nr:MAG: DNA-directed RNA polymerase subunit D [Candidatus Pacearchaeota archaeon]